MEEKSEYFKLKYKTGHQRFRDCVVVFSFFRVCVCVCVCFCVCFLYNFYFLFFSSHVRMILDYNLFNVNAENDDSKWIWKMYLNYNLEMNVMVRSKFGRMCLYANINACVCVCMSFFLHVFSVFFVIKNLQSVY